jgi:glucokinase
MLDVEKGICLEWQGIPHWQGLPLRDRLQTVFEMPVTLDDRSRAVGLALHLLYEQNRRHRSAIYVNIGTGIGACILLDGRILRGATLAGGEIGHMVIDRNGPLCQCGNRGCVESFASLPATLARANAALAAGANSSLESLSREELTAERLVSAAQGGDELARECLAQTAQALGTGIANAVQLLNPSLVVLAGKFAHISRDFLRDQVHARMLSQCFETASRSLEVRVAPIRKDLAPVGCALLATLDVASEALQRTLFSPVSKPTHLLRKQSSSKTA